MIDGFHLERIAKLIEANDALDPRDRVMLEDYLDMFPVSEEPDAPAVSEAALRKIRAQIEKLLANTSVRVAIPREGLPPPEDGGEGGAEEPNMGPAFMDRKKVRKKKGVPL